MDLVSFDLVKNIGPRQAAAAQNLDVMQSNPIIRQTYENPTWIFLSLSKTCESWILSEAMLRDPPDRTTQVVVCRFNDYNYYKFSETSLFVTVESKFKDSCCLVRTTRGIGEIQFQTSGADPQTRVYVSDPAAPSFPLQPSVSLFSGVNEPQVSKTSDSSYSFSL